MRLLKKIALVLIALVVVAQFVPVSQTNPPVEQDVAAPDPVASILRESCYDCHSNETVWPWYSRVAPVKFLVSHDVNEGREHLNFSTWNRLSPEKRREALNEIWEEVDGGRMPLGIYLPMHPSARLTDVEKAAIRTWTETSIADMAGGMASAR